MAVRRLQTTPSQATFADLGVPAPLVAALATRGIIDPFPIQTATLPDAIAGRDVLGRGRTGSGKTYAFVLPMLIRLARSRAQRRPGRPRALVLVPTRELATQVEAAMAPLAQALSMKTLTVFGGVGPNPQISALRAGVDVLVACPGRLDDHVRSGHAQLDAIEVTVLDEADHMADLGFLPVVRRLLDATPHNAQRLLFSATLDAGVDVLVRRYLTDPVTHSVDPITAAPIDMTHHVLHLRDEDRFQVLVELTAAPGRTVVFTRTKRGAKTLTRRLVAAGVRAVELHGNLAQNARDRNLHAFSDGSARTLVATDIAARGIHVDDVALVIHADPPAEHKAYLHRSGRTARAGASGTVITLMTDKQTGDVRQLTREAGIKPTITKTRPGDVLLAELAPGERTFHEPAPEPIPAPRSGRGGGRRTDADTDTHAVSAGRRSGRGRGAGGQGAQAAPDSDGQARRRRPVNQREGQSEAQRGGQPQSATQQARPSRQPRQGATGEGRQRAEGRPRAEGRAGRAGDGQVKAQGQPAAAQGKPAGAAAFSSQTRVGRRSGR